MACDLHFHLGPVDAFVAAGRRLRDSWAGSFILSRLIGEALAEVLVPTTNDRARPIALIDPLAHTADEAVDPTLRAILSTRPGSERGLAAAEQPMLGTLVNVFQARFDRTDDAVAAGQAAEWALRRRWQVIADRVRKDVLGDFAFAGSCETCNAIWDAQIGTNPDSTDYWEIYWTAVPVAKGDGSEPGGLNPLAVRKLARTPRSRPNDDAAFTRGGLCTLHGGMVDVSGLERRFDRPAFEAFWEKMRIQILTYRYGPDGADYPVDSCLDLRGGEALSAPALVKRLFPLLGVREEGRPAMREVIGWVPDIRSVGVYVPPEPPPSENWLRAAWRRLVDPDSARRDAASTQQSSPGLALGVDADPMPEAALTEAHRQSALNWPSVAAVAAQHWIVRVHSGGSKSRQAAGDFERWVIQGPGRPHAVAERQLWLKALRNNAGPLSNLDAGLFDLDRVSTLETREVASAQQTGSSRRRRFEAGATALKALQDCDDVPSAAATAGTPVRLGAPPGWYAVVRADGDSIGAARGQGGDVAVAISGILNTFSEGVRGSSLNASIGAVAEANGLTVFAGGDDVLALCPVDDAYDVASAIRQTFLDARDKAVDRMREKLEANSDKKSSGRPQTAPLAVLSGLTLSVAVVLAELRTPLGWVMKEARDLLNATAKEACGRDALAIAARDLSGLRSNWAAPFGSASQQGLAHLIDLARQEKPALWSNQFYHDVTSALRPFRVSNLFKNALEEFDARAAAMAASGHPSSPETDPPIIRALIAGQVKDFKLAKTPEDLGRIVDHLVAVLTPTKRVGRAIVTYDGVISPAALDVLRVIRTNWQKSAPGTQVLTDGRNPASTDSSNDDLNSAAEMGET